MIDRQESAIVRPASTIEDRASAIGARNRSRKNRDDQERKQLTIDIRVLREECKKNRKNFGPVLDLTCVPKQTLSDWEREFGFTKSGTYEVENLSGTGPEVEETGSKLPVSNTMPSPSANGHQSREERLKMTAPQSHPAVSNGVSRNGTPSANGHAANSNGVHKSEAQEDEKTSIDAQIKSVNHTIESFCRSITSLVESDCPEDIWLDDLGRRDAAIQKFKDACTTLRTAKCHAACPQCEGEGCTHCRKSGRVPKATYDQLR